MKALVLADMHDDFHWRGESISIDLILSCGDVADPVLLEAAQSCHCNKIFAVKGNHDSNTPFPKPIEDLHLKVIEFAGLTFAGFNGSWKYKPKGHFLYEQFEASGLLSAVPHVDVFVAHNSPRRVHDKEDGTHYGFDAFVTYISTKKPQLFLHGHQHVNCETIVGQTRVVGIFGHRMLEIQTNA